MARFQFPSRVVPSERTNDKFGKYRFPKDLGPNGMVIDFVKYSYRNTTNSVAPRTQTSIVLPLPEQIQDAYSIRIQEGDLGVVGAGVVDQFGSGGGPAAFQQQATTLLDKIEESGAQTAREGFGNLLDILGGGTRYAKFLSRSVLDQLGGGLSLATDIVTGSAVNPHTTLNFDGVNLKNFQFSWQLAPRSEAESDELRDIINKIKYHTLPKYSTLPGFPQSGNRATDRALLKYPDIAMVRFNGLAPNHWFKIKPAMIDNLTVNYSPQGNVLLEGGKPAVVNMSISLKEAQIHTSGEAENESLINSTRGETF